MFHVDRGLFITRNGLAVDVRRRQPRGFISHAHADHIARHQLTLCTTPTAQMYRHRLGSRPVKILDYRQPLELGGVQLVTYPAGHVLGSAMLLAEQDGRRLLYTGDFKLSRSRTCEQAELPRAEILVIESTFGDPKFRFPSRECAERQLLATVSDALERQRTPVVHAYVLGKAQEVTRILTDAGILVTQHPLVYEISRIYEACGCELGNYGLYDQRPVRGTAVVVPPRSQRCAQLDGLGQHVRIGVSGWALDEEMARQLGVDRVVPLSDHADFDELVSAVEQVRPERIYTTHGPTKFADLLRQRGWNAEVLG